jgi:hypothetical protein
MWLTYRLKRVIVGTVVPFVIPSPVTFPVISFPFTIICYPHCIQQHRNTFGPRSI